ncbi:MAG TPA: ABC transporter ATP-binding protein [Candidatus Eisenbacteria bacterium]
MSQLAVEGLDVYYGAVHALKGVSLHVDAGEIVTLIGANGAGKTTLLRTISGVVPARGGRIVFEGKDISRLPAHEIVGLGVSQSPEGRMVFANLSVEDNLELGAYRRKDRPGIRADRDAVYQLFPRLLERRKQLSGTLSGGEQQMLALGRALMLAPKILLVDEPSVGLAPILVARTIDTIKALKEKYQLTVLMAEQNFNQAIRIADRGYVIVHGRIAFEGKSTDELNNNELIRKFYMGM